MNTCCESVRIPGLGFYKSRTCGKSAKVERDGKWYCLIHDPVARKEKADKRYAAYTAQSRRRQNLLERQWDCTRACEGIPDPMKAIPEMIEALRAVVNNDPFKADKAAAALAGVNNSASNS